MFSLLSYIIIFVSFLLITFLLLTAFSNSFRERIPFLRKVKRVKAHLFFIPIIFSFLVVSIVELDGVKEEVQIYGCYHNWKVNNDRSGVKYVDNSNRDVSDFFNEMKFNEARDTLIVEGKKGGNVKLIIPKDAFKKKVKLKIQ